MIYLMLIFVYKQYIIHRCEHKNNQHLKIQHYNQLKAFFKIRNRSNIPISSCRRTLHRPVQKRNINIFMRRVYESKLFFRRNIRVHIFLVLFPQQTRVISIQVRWVGVGVGVWGPPYPYPLYSDLQIEYMIQELICIDI